MAHWDFLSNHALVLIHVLEHPRSTVREIAAAADITERHAISILRALEEEDIVSRQRGPAQPLLGEPRGLAAPPPAGSIQCRRVG